MSPWPARTGAHPRRAAGACLATAATLAVCASPALAVPNPLAGTPPGKARAAALATTAVGLPLSQRTIAPFQPLALRKGAMVELKPRTVRADRGPILRLADRPDEGGWVAVTTQLPFQSTVRQRQVIKVVQQTLRPGAARALASTNSSDGHTYQAGLFRDRASELRWATWLRLPNGSRVDLRASRVRARLGTWTKVDLLSVWGLQTSGATLRIDGRRVARTKVRDLRGIFAKRITLGFGRSSTKEETGILLVRAARVDSSIPTDPPEAPTAPTADMIAGVPPPPPPPEAALSGPPPPPAALPGREVDRGDFETGDLSQWSGRQSVLPERIQVERDRVREGQFAGRFEVRNGENPIGFGDRAELQRRVNEREGDERWYSWSTMFDESFPSADESVWQVVNQWHCTCDGSPSVAFYVWRENYYFQVRDGSPEEIVWRTPLARGTWHDIVLHVKWSDDPTVGFVELWQNGVPVTGKIMKRTLYPGQSAYFKQGYYRRSGEPQTGVVYHDGYRANAV